MEQIELRSIKSVGFYTHRSNKQNIFHSKIIGLAFIVLLIFPAMMFGQAGSTGLSFLKLGLGSRAVSMGETYVASNAEPYALNYNPASLALSTNARMIFSHREWIQDTRSEFLGASAGTGNLSFGFGLHSVSVSDIQLRTVPGPVQESFDAKNVSIGVGAAYCFSDELRIGVTANYFFEKILVDEASGYGLNIGALYETPWDIRLGFAVDHLGSMNELNTTASTLPTTIRFGGSREIALMTIESNITAAAEIVSVKNEGTAHVHLGAEFEFQKLFALRAGYQTGYESKNITTGVGFKYSIFRLDYAFVPVKLDLGSSHTFTIGIELDEM